MRSLFATGALAVVLAACGGGIPELSPPVGTPVLPDLVPEPPIDLRVTMEEGRTTIRFSSTLVNVGDGDFVLRAERKLGVWVVHQELWYSDSGADLIRTDADVVWGGDGHDHWHIRRVANYTLVPLDTVGNPVEGATALPDGKIGFCFFDHSQVLTKGPKEAVYDLEKCGHEDDTEIRMGMSPGWADVYGFDLPGQSIDITDVPDGSYRVWAEADSERWFQEVSTDNNLTWIDIELTTQAQDGLRYAQIVDVGPSPTD